jgi:hypothetical protein
MRVALCLSGLCRNWDEAYPPLKETILDRYDPDIFVSVWDKDYTETFESTHLAALDDLERHKLISWEDRRSSEYKFLISDFMEQYFDRSRQKCFTSEFDIKKGLRTSHGKINVLNMYYLIERCNYLRNIFQVEAHKNYDVVIRARIDRAWELNHDLKTDPDTIYFHNLKDDLSDWFAYGPPDLMDIYSSVYQLLPSLAGYMELSARTSKCYNCGKKVASERQLHGEDSRLYRGWLNPHNCLSTVLDFAEKPIKKVILSREEVRGHMIGEADRLAAWERQKSGD